MKRLFTLLLCLCIIGCNLSLTGVLKISALALTDEQIAAKNYPVPEGYAVDETLITFDTDAECGGSANRSTVTGTFFDTSSRIVTSTQAWQEKPVCASRVSLSGTGFMFWYKSDIATMFRLRNQSNDIIAVGNLTAAPNGKWITYYYTGQCVNFTFKSDMNPNISEYIETHESDTYMLNLMTSNSTGCTTYVDEFYTFDVAPEPEPEPGKNYPLPTGYEVGESNFTYDTDSECGGSANRSTDEGTYFDVSSRKATATQAWQEKSVFPSRIALTGEGFMFWYKSDSSVSFRLKNQNNSVIAAGNLSASSGQWITYYYTGQCVNFTFKSDMTANISSHIAENPNDTYMLSFINGSSSGFTAYIDEFYTFAEEQETTTESTTQTEPTEPEPTQPSQPSGKNYPLPTGYEVGESNFTYDTDAECGGSANRSTDEGTYFDVSSRKAVATQAWQEKSVLPSRIAFSGAGIMFWYKSDSAVSFRFKNQNNEVIAAGNLAASSGQWITYYYTGQCVNFTFKSDMTANISSHIENHPNDTYMLGFINGSSSGFTAYIDEFYTFAEPVPEPEPTKNYPLAEGYETGDTVVTFDTDEECGGSANRSTVEGTYFDTSSRKVTTTQAWQEKGVFASRVSLSGKGFMFWYKADVSSMFRLRNQNGNIIAVGNLPAAPDGSWITYYFNGECINFTFKSDMNANISDYIENHQSDTYMLNMMCSNSTGYTVYVDEFYTFVPGITPADSYSSNEEVFKFSLARFEEMTKTNAQYFDDGSVKLTSRYGSTASNSPINISYALDSTRLQNAINIANQGSGYLKITCDNINCVNSSNEEAYALVTVNFNGVNRAVKKHIYGSGTSDTYLIKVSDLTDVSSVDKLTVTITGTGLKNVEFKLSPITVYHFPQGETIVQAEDTNPKKLTSSGVADANINVDSDNCRTYVYGNASDSYLSFTLPNLEVGEYDVYACCYALQNTDVKFNVSVNNRREITNLLFSDETYVSKRHITNINIGQLTITKNYSDGPSTLKLSVVPQCKAGVYIDYFSFKKTPTPITAEPSSNFAISSYPEMQNYEVMRVLNTFDDYICGTDTRYYMQNQIAGYKRDGNAFNLNSRATANKSYFDNNVIWSSRANPLDGNGIRFWYKATSSATLQLVRTNGSMYTVTLSASTGWKTIYYKDVVSNGDLSDVYEIRLKTNSASSYYIDELHTIQEKIGDVTYELNGDGTASVTGYYLRLTDVVINSTYQGCPVVSIANGALANSLTLKSVVIPSSVTSIGEGAFSGCLNLETVNFGSVTSIGANAFNNCKKLTNVTLPNSATSVSNTAFSGCTALYFNVTNNSFAKTYCTTNSIDYKCTTSSGIKYYCDFNTNGNAIKIIGYTGNASSLTIPTTIDSITVKSIESGAFENNTSLVSVTASSDVTAVKDNAFKGCTSLETVDVSGVTSIGEKAFYGCANLEEIDVGYSLLTIAKEAFYNCTSLEEFYFSDTITSIADRAFFNCDVKAVMSETTYAAKTGYAYSYVNDNSIVYYPTTSSNFKYFVINYIATVYNYTGNATAITIPATIDGYSVRNIGKDAFKNNTSITSVTLTEGIRTIKEYAFYGCTSLSSVTLVDSLREIEGYAFANCSSLSAITINNVVVVSSTAFNSSPTQITYLQTNFIRNALDYVDGMTAGWNLGNTLDAHRRQYSYGDLTVSQSEHLWRSYDYISQDLFNMVAQKFNTIRIPITWNAFIDPNNNYTIDTDYMNRIQQVVEMCYNAGFDYIIINTHHDSDYYFNVHPNNDFNQAQTVIARVWQQICSRFANYDEKLIFESMNEIRSIDVNNPNSNGDWYGQTDDLFTRLNTLNQIFYSTVRNSGGNNADRYLMIQTYGGQNQARQLNNFWFPSAAVDNHMIASVHWYIETINSGDYTATLQRLKSKFIDHGIPCVIGEIGLPAYLDESGNITVYDDDYREQWGTLAFGLFNQYNLRAIIWDDQGFYSTVVKSGNTYSWKFPKYINSIYQATKKD